ncbi:serine/threonine-protein phosphatase 6 regulatory ankyrin repeat subunit C-like [Physella acuta]|uniref:serine/threonine-protein phosphatase 6 regulatory ankyrin repeat subunit C-like n=1 Tax=Physella acuta TaxID=109671 RepID=UPI0027DE484F|nr:serine/threonine-protein phosphatase 6 regulatory ankyrin repeat subunit C-like [Physella acuta]
MRNRDIECVKELIRAGCFFNCDRGLEALEMAKNERFMAAVAEGEKAMQKYLKHDSDQHGTSFCVAFINERIDLLNELINAGVSINLKYLNCDNLSRKEALIYMLPISPQNNPSGAVGNLETMLSHTVQLQETSIVKILIEKYSDLDIVNFSKNKALQVACSGDRVELINALLVGAKMEAVSCSHIEIVKLLVSSGADVNCIDEDGSTLFIKAVQSKQMEIVKFFLEKKVNIDQADDSQSTALHYACRSNSLEIVKLLVNAGAKVEVFNNESSTPFSIACKISNMDMMKLLINAGSDINCVDTYQRTPLINSIRGENQQKPLYNLIGCFHYSAPYINSTTESHFDTTQFLLEHGADISNVDIDGMTALMWAAKTNNEQVFDLLLDLKPVVNCVDLKQTTTLAFAVLSSNVHMVAKLIQAGADVNIASNRQVKTHAFCMNPILSKMQNIVEKCSSGKNTPLHLSGNSRYDSNKIVNLLLKSGANIQALDKHGRTPLHITATAGNLVILQSLCQFGANINAVDNYGNSPLFTALLFEHKEVSKYLIECGADVNVICESLCTPIIAAVLSSDSELIHLLIQHGAILDINKYSKLMVALEHGNVDVTIALLENGAATNILDTKKTPPLTIAIKQAIGAYISKGRLIYLDQLTNGRKEIKHVAELFLNNGANISATDDEGNSCQHEAAKFCSANIFELFVAHKADVNVQNAKGETPLMIACSVGNVEVVKYLLTVGADVTLVDENKDTALHHTTLNGNKMWRTTDIISEFPPEIPPNLNLKNNQENTPLFLLTNDNMINYLIDAGTDINLQNKLGETALHNACNVNVARVLLEMGADMNIRTDNGQTALMYATAAGQYSLAQFFVEQGGYVNMQDNCGKNALMLAIDNYAHNTMLTRKCIINFVTILLEHGADVNASDATGQTACMIAAKKDYTEYILEVLPKFAAYGADLNQVDSENKSVLVHILLNFYRNKLNCILDILQLGADMAVDNEYRYLVKEMSNEIETHKEYGRTTSDLSQRLFQFCLVNGCILLKAFNLWGIDKALQLPHFMSFNSLVFVKYLFATGMIFKCDLQRFRKFKEDNSVNATTLNIPPELQSAIQEPWPLVKLAFIEVSTLLGTGPMREEKLKQTKLPPKLQRTLMFQEPISRLPVEDWSKIPLCFDPVQYETLPCPRPLLYYWPIGHRLVV